jgi:chromosome segregation ATPase
MKKFMVTVNNKYIVAVESTSNGGAEHVVLDNVKNAKSALAFDIEAGETQWEMFHSALKEMEVISIQELHQKDREAQRQKMVAMNELAEERQYYEMEIKRIEEKLAMTKHELETTNLNIKEAEKASGLFCRFYSQEEMA